MEPFRVPNAKQRRAAIGIETVPTKFRPIYEPDPEFFDPIPEPGSHDWLAGPGLSERKETFSMFCKKNKAKTETRRIYILPIGDFPENCSPNLECLIELSTAFFSLPHTLLEGVQVKEISEYECQFKWKDQVFNSVTCRENSGSKQLLTKSIHKVASSIKSSFNDAFCVLAITMYDLYPKPEWNFVFGEALIPKGVGVFSFVRYSPVFENNASTLTDKDKQLLQIRSANVMLHEITHLFGVDHCCYFSCLLNGANHMVESDSKPMHICPMDLHKLQHVIGFDPMEIYKNLLTVYEKYEIYFKNEKKWMSERIKKIELHFT